MTPADASYAWTPSPDQVERSRIKHFLDSLGVPDLETLQRFAAAEPEHFWTAVADDIGLEWTSRFTQAIDTSPGLPWTRFWCGGRINLTTIAVARWAARDPEREALVWEGDGGEVRRFTYADLDEAVRRAAAALTTLGVGPGEAVGVCMPMVPETAVLFLACARLGAIVAPLFSGYGAGAIASRLRDCDAKVLCITDGFPRRGAPVDLKSTAEQAAAECPSLQHILVVRRLDGSCAMRPPRDRWYHELLPESAPTLQPADTAADTPFMIIYTSGTTGRPKGTLHVHGGFPVKAAQDMAHCFDVGRDDRLLWFTDIGWMMGPWVIAGALIHGATLVLYEGAPDHPAPDRLWAVIERHRVSVLGVAPTVVRALMRHGDEPVRAHDLGSLRVLGSSGEPWNAGPWLWFQRVVGAGRCPVINYSGGTEVSGGILGCSMLTPLQPAAFGGPVPGMAADVVDDDCNSVRGRVGELVVRAPWPGMTQGFWHDPDRYLDTYWSRFAGVWVHGDWAEVAGDGLWYIRGRSDDTLKIAGKRLGPAEVESALVADPAVAEAAAIGVPDAVKGEALVAFVVLKPGTEDSETLRAALRRRITDELGKALAPKAIEIVAELPKTRNAKVLRRVVRAVYLGNDPGDMSSLENHTAIDAIAAVRR